MVKKHPLCFVSGGLKEHQKKQKGRRKLASVKAAVAKRLSDSYGVGVDSDIDKSDDEEEIPDIELYEKMMTDLIDKLKSSNNFIRNKAPNSDTITIHILPIDSVYLQAILPMRVTLFPSGMLCITNTPSINGNNALFCSELNREHAGERFRSLRLIAFETC